MSPVETDEKAGAAASSEAAAPAFSGERLNQCWGGRVSS
ncbi:hypothetical protein FM105_10270 [Brevibacterium yomogidense]|uniref:Uncharacterized protein n=1 Tax=Brevibacterium yomogidense TaxID=946573 RepID=A0A1X6XJD5_9MICO|nr:hypothetical protein FM105_10270 [Brevibacterium yomogidense]